MTLTKEEHNKKKTNTIAGTALAVLAMVWFAVASCMASTPPDDTRSILLKAGADARPDSSLTVSLITCWPGSEIYELYGHSAIRVRGNGIDSAWNYGIFDFNKPNFVYRFVKGETDYLVAGYPFEWFMPEYVADGRKVMEQDLNLTPEEASRLLAMLRRERMEDTREYRYNYVKDNCATRILDRIAMASENHVIYPDTIKYGTFRNEMRAYNVNYPWYQFGIDLALGSGIDYTLETKEEMFVPVEMFEKAAGAHFSDGRMLVKASRTLNEGRGPAQLPPTPWWLTPLAASILVLMTTAGVCGAELYLKKIIKWWNSIFFIITGLGGCLVLFLVAASEHEATSPNILVYWLNPLQLFAGIFLWWRRTRIVTKVTAYYNCTALAVLLLSWPWQAQHTNPALFPVAASALILSATYAIIATKDSYNINEQTGHKRAIQSRRNQHRASGRPDKA